MGWLPERWHGDQEPEDARFDQGRQDALSRGMRDAAKRDLPGSPGDWSPDRVPSPRQSRKQERDTARQRADEAARQRGRAETLARAMDQSRRQQQERRQRREQSR
jgi:hypothetical protein